MRRFRFYKDLTNNYHSLWMREGNKRLWLCIKTSHKRYDSVNESSLIPIPEWNSYEGHISEEFDAESVEDAIERVFVEIL